MAKSLRDILPKPPKEGFSGKISSKIASPKINKDNFYNWEGGDDGVKFIDKHKTETHDYPYDAEAAFTSGKVKQAKFPRQTDKVYEAKCNMSEEGVMCEVHGNDQCPGYGNKKKGRQLLLGKTLKEVLKVNEGAKVDRMVAHIKSSEKTAGKSDKEAERIAWATVNKRGMLDNKNKMEEEVEQVEEEKWIQKAIKKPGALHKQLGVPEGEKIPAGKLKAAAEKGGKLGQRARLAQTLSKLHKEDLAMPMLEGGKKKKNKKMENEQTDTPITYPSGNVGDMPGRI